MSFAAFEAQFGAQYEDLFFYGGDVWIKYDHLKHEYYRVDADGEMHLLRSASQVCHVIDKSLALVPWAVKMMSQKIFATIPKVVTKSGTEAVIMPYVDFEKAVMAAKTAHKDRLEDAGDVGAATHNWIERYIVAVISGMPGTVEQVLANMPPDSRSENGCRAMLDWARQHRVRFIATEQKVYSRSTDTPGTEDSKAYVSSCGDRKCCPVEFEDRLSLIDWKTSNNLYIEYIMQVSLYWHAEQEEHGTQFEDAWVIRLGKEDGEFDPWHLSPEAMACGWKAFRSAAQLCRDLEELEEAEKARKDAVSVIRKAEQTAARELKEREACSYSSKFKGSRAPTCNDGKGCTKCLQIFLDRQVEKMFGWVWKENTTLLLPSGDPADDAVTETPYLVRSGPYKRSSLGRELLASLSSIGLR